MMQDGSVMVSHGPGHGPGHVHGPGHGAGVPSVYEHAPGSAAGPQDPFHQPDQAQFEADKRAVYKHPLFPLLALLFERCEQATQSAECPNSDSFNMDIQAFVQHQERDRKPFLMNDPEVDGLMIKAIQVLRIHLLELEKVQELCKDFCNRYITCLKGKMQSENLLRSDYASGYEHNNNNNSCHSSESSSPPGQHSSYPTSPHAGHITPVSPHPAQVVSSTGGGGGGGLGGGPQHQQQQQQPQQQQQRFAASVPAGGPAAGGGDLLGGSLASALGPAGVGCPSAGAAAAAGSGSGPGPGAGPVSGPGVGTVAAGGLYALALSPAPGSVPVPGHGAEPPTPPTPASPGLIHGSTPLSQIGANPFPPPNDNSLMHGTLSPSPGSPNSGDEDDDFFGRGKKQKRGILPKHATSIMRSWLFQHLVHPYPTEDEKRTIAAQTNLTLLQVNNWFINARRRILQPMLDASNTADPAGAGNNNHSVTKSAGNKKSKTANKDAARNNAAQRFWPETMASLPHLLAQDQNDSSLLSSGGEDSDGEGDGWSQEEDADEGMDESEGDLSISNPRHRLKAEPNSDSEQ